MLADMSLVQVFGTLVIPTIGMIITMITTAVIITAKVRGWLDEARKEIRTELADERRQMEARLVAYDAFMRTAPNEFASREDFVRESVLLRGDIKQLIQSVAELRGESAALGHLTQAVVTALERNHNGDSDPGERR